MKKRTTSVQIVIPLTLPPIAYVVHLIRLSLKAHMAKKLPCLLFISYSKKFLTMMTEKLRRALSRD